MRLTGTLLTKFIQGLALCGLFFCLLKTPVQAISTAQGYTTQDSELVVGMAASLTDNSSNSSQTVERTSTENVNKFVGIVTTKEASLVTLTNDTASIYVARQGSTAAFATTLNGDIKKGDFLTASPLKGVVMKASLTDSRILGTALEDFDDATAHNQSIEDVTGQRNALVNSLKIELNPRSIAGTDEAKKPLLVLFGQSLTGKDVSQWQVFAALVVFLILLIAEGSIIYGAIHSTITSLGRNPLAKKAVYKQLLQVLGLVLLVFAFGLSTIYVILWA